MAPKMLSITEVKADIICSPFILFSSYICDGMKNPGLASTGVAVLLVAKALMREPWYSMSNGKSIVELPFHCCCESVNLTLFYSKLVMYLSIIESWVLEMSLNRKMCSGRPEVVSWLEPRPYPPRPAFSAQDKLSCSEREGGLYFHISKPRNR